MPAEPVRPCLGTEILGGFLKKFGCRLAEADDIERTMRGIAKARGENWPWVAQWVQEEGPRWVNDMETLVYEAPLENFVGEQCFHFTQQVSMLRPSLFGYSVWGDRVFVKMWWDPDRSALPCVVECDEEDQDCHVMDLPQYVAWSDRKRREGVPEALMDRLDALIVWIKPREAAEWTEADFEEWLEGARRESEVR